MLAGKSHIKVKPTFQSWRNTPPAKTPQHKNPNRSLQSLPQSNQQEIHQLQLTQSLQLNAYMIIPVGNTYNYLHTQGATVNSTQETPQAAASANTQSTSKLIHRSYTNYNYNNQSIKTAAKIEARLKHPQNQHSKWKLTVILNLTNTPTTNAASAKSNCSNSSPNAAVYRNPNHKALQQLQLEQLKELRQTKTATI
eukprot:gene13120-8966_t